MHTTEDESWKINIYGQTNVILQSKHCTYDSFVSISLNNLFMICEIVKILKSF